MPFFGRKPKTLSLTQQSKIILISLPLDGTPLDYNWIFHEKLRPYGSIEKYKDLDFLDSYFLVTRITTLRTLFAIDSIHKLIFHQMNMKIAFLNENLDEDINIEHPKKFVVKGQENKLLSSSYMV